MRNKFLFFGIISSLLICVSFGVSASFATPESAQLKTVQKPKSTTWELWLQKHKVNYDESAVKISNIPDVLTNPANGHRAKSAVDWLENVRPQIVAEVEKLYCPRPPRPLAMRFEVVESGEAYSGKAVRKQIRVFVRGDTGAEKSFNVLMYAPKNASRPVPAFIAMNYYGNHAITDDKNVLVPDCWISNKNAFGVKIQDNKPCEELRGVRICRHPIETILDNGFAYFSVFYNELFPDTADTSVNADNLSAIFSDAIYPHKRAAIAVWSWGLSRIMDYIETDPMVDKSKVAVVGHSRHGKTALVTGALDIRFAIAVSNGSGCMGAKLSRRNFGENISSISEKYGYWFSDELKKYASAEDKMPIDQHQLLALMAPRPVYVESAVADRWADPKGQLAALVAANPVYELFGAKNLPTMANENVPFCGNTGYHLREGKHDITSEDWGYFIKFAKMHFGM